MNRRAALIVIAAAGLGVTGACLGLAGLQEAAMMWMYHGSYQKLGGVEIGMTEAYAVEQMGREPNLVIRHLDELRGGSGYSLPARPVGHRALVYLESDGAMVLVYIDCRGRVEWAYLGGS